MNKVM